MSASSSAWRARQPKLVFRVFEEIKRESIKVDSRVYIHLLNACRLCGRFTACEAVFAQMKECKPPVLSTVLPKSRYRSPNKL